MEMRSLFVGASPAMRAILREVACAAKSDAKVLITGESGVGKEIVAKLIHQQSRRARAPLVTLNCAGVPESLLESELFGHERGSFTDAHRDKRGYMERADGGTIFMDEVGEMSLRMQALLLRFLENGEIQRVGSERVQARVDVRVISATNRNLLAEMTGKRFRDDLYYRLNVIHIPIPPLRERREDIPLLFEHFVRDYSEQHGLEPPCVQAAAMACLTAYGWPGNVRELKNAAERIVVRSQSGAVSVADLPSEIGRAASHSPSHSPSLTPAPPRSASAAPARPLADLLLERMRVGGESFWSAVYAPFMARDLTRQELRSIVDRGLEETRGSYKALVPAFNLDPEDYKRFLNFLRKHRCHVPFQWFRTLPLPKHAGDQLAAATPCGREPLEAAAHQ
jgi:DNA-binding NtrC family response regulator